VYFQQVNIEGFWKDQVKRLTETWIPHCLRQMEAGGAGQELLNLVHTAKIFSGEPAGEFTGCPWSDAYVYNTIESICLALAVDPQGDAELAAAQTFLRRKLDEWIPIVLAAQMEDGYIHSFHVVNRRDRYTDINSHEFYVQGYFLEMGVAHYRITGGKDRRLYDAARKCADHLCATFGPPPKRVWIHGHAGMGYALCRLGRLVNEVEGQGQGDPYIRLAKFLLDTRHTVEEHRSPYRQSHRAVIEMEHAVGHAVRATYFYTAIADLAVLADDPAYQEAVDRIWTSAIHRKHYVTGGVGASPRGEAFAEDYDLRNNGYCESCAACGMTFWADRMHRHHGNAHYVDVQERALYNAILGAIELSGENFFYQNPLASDKARYPWHGCPCCVGNIPRALLGIKDLMYAVNPQRDTLYVNHFVHSAGTIANVAGQPLRITQETAYPWQGDVAMTLHPHEPVAFTLKIRIPDRTESDLYTARPDLTGKYQLEVNGQAADADLVDGYAVLQRTWRPGDRVDLSLPMDVQRVYADERVTADRGRVALQRGPIVYNIEDVDNDGQARTLVLKPDTPLHATWKGELLGGVMVIEGPGLLAVPNFVRLNRGGWSQVWIIEDPDKITHEPPPDHGSAELVVKPFPRPDLDPRTIDKVIVGDATSEKAHDQKGDRTSAGIFRDRAWRHAVGGGWFSYELAVDPDAINTLLITYWGSDTGNREFTVLVDGQPIAEQTLNYNRPNEFFDVEHPIPAKLTGGKQKITVRFGARPHATAGGIFDLRIVHGELHTRSE
jgi:DUF1680 family protein